MPRLSEEEKKTNDMVRIIKERLEQLPVDSAFYHSADEGVKGQQGRDFYGGNEGNYLHEVSQSLHALPPAVGYAEWEPATRDRAWSSVSSTASSSMRAFDEDLARGWQPVDEQSWQVRSRPVWKCKYCPGVGWAEEEPCDGCGRFLPENMYAATSRRMMPMREGDWICECCGNTNWEWRMQCNRCHTCRAGSVAAGVEGIVKQRLKKRLSTHPAGVFKDNDWVCVSCGNINWDWREKCHQCASGKPQPLTHT